MDSRVPGWKSRGRDEKKAVKRIMIKKEKMTKKELEKRLVRSVGFAVVDFQTTTAAITTTTATAQPIPISDLNSLIVNILT